VVINSASIVRSATQATTGGFAPEGTPPPLQSACRASL